MDQTGDHSSSGPDDDEDDLLRTIRQMVSDEAARAPAQAPSHFPGAEPAGLSTSEPAAKPAESQPLVLGAMARVEPEEPRDFSAPTEPEAETGTALEALVAAKDMDPAALRTLMREAVQEELDLVLGDILAQRVRQLVRRELADLLSKAREQD